MEMVNRLKSNESSIVFLSILIGIFSCALSLFLSEFLHPFLILFASIIFVALLGFGWKLWWLCFPVSAFIGSNFNVGFKIYPEEIGLVISCSILILLIVLNKSKVLRKNNRLNITFLGLILFIILHMTVSITIGQAGLLEGAGSIIRVYAASLTWLIFSFFLYRYGATHQIRIIFIVSLFVLMLRNVISASNFFLFSETVADKTATLVLPSLVELRFSALLSIFISIVVFYIVKSRFIKTTFILYIFTMITLVMIGQGRVSTATALLIIIFWVFFTKKTKIILSFCTVLLVAMTLIYFNIGVLAGLPIQAQRAISFVQVSDDLDLIGARGISASDDWHKELLQLGFVRWSRSFGNLVFGNMIDPTDAKDFFVINYQRRLEIAVNTARYENTLWTVLATLGIVGFSLYVMIFWILLKEIVPVVIKKGINNYNSAVYGVAFLSTLLMVIFIWIRGGFPGFELLFCVMAKMLYEDTKAGKVNINNQNCL